MGGIGSGSRGAKPGFHAEIESAYGLFLAEDLGGFESCHAAEKSPERDGSLLRAGLTRNLSHISYQEEPYFVVRVPVLLGAVAAHHDNLMHGSLLTGELEISEGHGPNGIFRSMPAGGFTKNGKEKSRTLGRQRCLQMSAVREIAIESVWRNAQFRRHRAQRQLSHATLGDLLKGGGEDGGAIGFCRISH